jgi:eukaryotic-like serine/threonine-protein kinase
VGGTACSPSKASDVWSFGVLLWEICSFAERIPYGDCADDEEAFALIRKGVPPSPDLPDGDDVVPAAVRDVMRQCLRPDPMDRPSMHHVAAALEKAAKQ